ncbi:MAG: polysaccharide biosynthesis protein [Oscillospiraceae bacterium]|nr:polysaccharide biosynthesis protein [Oscillospiraceae bacterium]
MSSQNQQKNSTFLGSAAVLAVGVIIVKIIGALYKIPLGVILTDAAYGDFNGAYNIYNFFLTISIAGLPVALSKTVSENNALERYNQVNRVFRVAFAAFLTMGIISFIFMSVFCKPVATYLIGNEKAVYCVLALSPAVLCTCCCSAFRGFAQGHMNMYPTTISQIIEALSKLFIGLGLAFFVLQLAIQPQDLGERLAAVGAIAGVSVGSVLSLTFLSTNHMRIKRRNRNRVSSDVPTERKVILKRLLALAIPITLSSCTMSIVTLIDTNLVMNQLQNVFQNVLDGLYGAPDSLHNIFEKATTLLNQNVAAALADPNAEINPTLDTARSLYGIYGKSMSIYNLPFNLITPMTASAVPAIAACLARKDLGGSRKISESALRFAAMIAIPAGLGLFVLGTPIIELIYLGQTEASIGGPLLSILGLASIFVCFQLICTSILQANGVVRLPIFTVVVGGIVKICVNLALVGRPEILIFGAPVGTLCCFIVVAILNFIIIKRLVPNPPSYLRALVKPTIAAIILAAAAWASHGLISNWVAGNGMAASLANFAAGIRPGTTFTESYMTNAVATIGAIIVALVVYLILIIFLRILSREDMELMPKGEKIAKFLRIR